MSGRLDVNADIIGLIIILMMGKNVVNAIVKNFKVIFLVEYVEILGKIMLHYLKKKKIGKNLVK